MVRVALPREYDYTPPTAVAGGNLTVPVRRTITLDGSASTDDVGVVEWTWSIVGEDGIVTLHGPITGYQFPAPGTYIVTLIVRDEGGNADTDAFTATVMPAEGGETSPDPHVDWWKDLSTFALVVVFFGLIVMMRRTAKRFGGRVGYRGDPRRRAENYERAKNPLHDGADQGNYCFRVKRG